MNKEIQEFARTTLKEGLSLCTDAQQLLFKRMYAGGNLEMDINDVVDNMSEDKLDHAMYQVQNTLEKNNG